MKSWCKVLWLTKNPATPSLITTCLVLTPLERNSGLLYSLRIASIGYSVPCMSVSLVTNSWWPALTYLVLMTRQTADYESISIILSRFVGVPCATLAFTCVEWGGSRSEHTRVSMTSSVHGVQEHEKMT